MRTGGTHIGTTLPPRSSQIWYLLNTTGAAELTAPRDQSEPEPWSIRMAID